MLFRRHRGRRGSLGGAVPGRRPLQHLPEHLLALGRAEGLEPRRGRRSLQDAEQVVRQQLVRLQHMRSLARRQQEVLLELLLLELL